MKLTVNVSPRGSGVIKVDSSQSTSELATFTFLVDDVVTLEAIPKDGYIFDHWSGYMTGKNNPVALRLTRPTLINARFLPLAK